jgi:hypothetical protein
MLGQMKMRQVHMLRQMYLYPRQAQILPAESFRPLLRCIDAILSTMIHLQIQPTLAAGTNSKRLDFLSVKSVM